MSAVPVDRVRTLALLFALSGLGGVHEAAAQEAQIGIIDFYGLQRLSADEVRRVLPFKEGDTLARDASDHLRRDAERRVSAMRGVVGASTSIVCCDNGQVLVYVGVREQGAPIPHFHAPPEGTVRLEPDIIQADIEFSRALQAAAQRGLAEEDDSQGHALARDPAMRAVQEHYIGYADQHVPELRAVLRHASDAHHRAVAAQVLAYVSDKQAVVEDLAYAVADPDGGVRNDAMRTLAVFLRTVPTSTRRVPHVPFEPFVAMLHSPDWTDRNKAAAAIEGVSRERDPALFEQLRIEALTPLIEMARWRYTGHAATPLRILGRMAGLSDEAIQGYIDRGERETLVRGAQSLR